MEKGRNKDQGEGKEGKVRVKNDGRNRRGREA